MSAGNSFAEPEIGGEEIVDVVVIPFDDDHILFR